MFFFCKEQGWHLIEFLPSFLRVYLRSFFVCLHTEAPDLEYDFSFFKAQVT